MKAIEPVAIILRDYFAAHAPDSPTWLFAPVMAKPRPEPVFVEDRHYPPVNTAELRQWDEEQLRQRAIQWPWVWADAVLAARGECE